MSAEETWRNLHNLAASFQELTQLRDTLASAVGLEKEIPALIEQRNGLSTKLLTLESGISSAKSRLENFDVEIQSKLSSLAADAAHIKGRLDSEIEAKKALVKDNIDALERSFSDRKTLHDVDMRMLSEAEDSAKLRLQGLNSAIADREQKLESLRQSARELAGG